MGHALGLGLTDLIREAYARLAPATSALGQTATFDTPLRNVRYSFVCHTFFGRSTQGFNRFRCPSTVSVIAVSGKTLPFFGNIFLPLRT